MKTIRQFGLTLLLLQAIAGTAAADETRETRPIDARVTQVKLDGMLHLKISQGAVPSLTIIGAPRALAQVHSDQSGRTLRLEGTGRAPVRAELVLPALRELSSDGYGSTEIAHFSSEELKLSLDGAGSIRVDCRCRRFSADLGGTGSMVIAVDGNERVALELEGAGSIVLSGAGKLLKASLGGVGSVNAQQFQAESVALELNGLGNATVTARDSASMSLSGLGSVTVYGQPRNRNVSIDGLGKVIWK